MPVRPPLERLSEVNRGVSSAPEEPAKETFLPVLAVPYIDTDPPPSDSGSGLERGWEGEWVRKGRGSVSNDAKVNMQK